MRLQINSSGFTLIELLVTISIIAILATVGMVLYSNAQSSARDSQRRSEIEAISQALETKYDGLSAQYNSLSDSDFGTGGIPTDPKDGVVSGCQGAFCKYCLKSSAGNCSANDSKVDSTHPANNSSTYIICTNLERGSPSFYCKSNQR